jgi:hypothetical protein
MKILREFDSRISRILFQKFFDEGLDVREVPE